MTHSEVNVTRRCGDADVVTESHDGADGFTVLPGGSQLVVTKGGEFTAVYAGGTWLCAEVVAADKCRCSR